MLKPNRSRRAESFGNRHIQGNACLPFEKEHNNNNNNNRKHFHDCHEH